MEYPSSRPNARRPPRVLRGKIVRTNRGEASLYVSKAVEFAAEARAALASGRHDAAILAAVHAGISGADAVCVALAGQRSTDPDHARAVDLLRQVARGASEVETKAKQLSALLQKKNTVEYESRRASAEEAADAVQRAGRFVDWTRATVDAASARRSRRES